MGLNKKFLSATVLTAITFSVFSSPAAYAWDSNQDPVQMDSHKLIVSQAVKILGTDMTDDETASFKSNYNKLVSNLYDLKRGAVAPDFSARNYSLYQDHFYDPDTDTNFTAALGLPLVLDTAESETRRYVSYAISKWDAGNYSDAAFTLGEALHYFADLCEPHHAANRIAGLSTHSQFEAFVDGERDNYAVSTTGSKTSSPFYQDSYSKYPCITDWLQGFAYNSAKLSKSVVQYTEASRPKSDWIYAATVGMKNAQTSEAVILYRFLKEVTSPSPQNSSGTINKFGVEIYTGDIQYAGTDDDIYFGMQFANGKTVEYKCDIPAINDFERNDTNYYEFNITDSSLAASDIRKIWLRKKNSLLGDDWYPGKMTINIKSKVFTYNINQWMKGNTTYSIDVNGLD